jgi:glutaminyl-peptide cyclotransferase
VADSMADYFCKNYSSSMKKLLWLAFIASLAACNNNDSNSSGNNNSTPPDAPKAISYSITTSFPHDTSSFTQGLMIYKGQLYEGTGWEGKSKLMQVDLTTGKIIRERKMDSSYFGEGITILNDTVYQLTWQDHVVLMYSLKDFKLLKQFPLSTEGWGITTDGRELIVSDGTSNLNFYEPGTFKQIRTVSITESGALVNNVNELEFIDGYVYANQYQTDNILKIDPVTGIVTGKIDFSNIGNEVRSKYTVDFFNGIAYDPATKKIYVTGKLWPKLYEVQFSN